MHNPLAILALTSMFMCIACKPTAAPPAKPIAAPPGLKKFHYLACDGGPHMLLPAAAAPAWRGVSSMTNVLDPKSDYGRACVAIAKDPFALLPVAASTALILQSPPMSAWGKSSDGLIEIYDLQAWDNTDLDSLITTATAALPTASLKDTGDTFELTSPDAFLLYAGDTITSFAYEVHRVPLPAGKYHLLTATYKSGINEIRIYRLKPD
jgi:hypothetical protein